MNSFVNRMRTRFRMHGFALHLYRYEFNIHFLEQDLRFISFKALIMEVRKADNLGGMLRREKIVSFENNWQVE